MPYGILWALRVIFRIMVFSYFTTFLTLKEHWARRKWVWEWEVASNSTPPSTPAHTQYLINISVKMTFEIPAKEMIIKKNFKAFKQKIFVPFQAESCEEDEKVFSLFVPLGRLQLQILIGL